MTWPATPASTDVFVEDLLAGETALVTGGGTGIGRAVALAFAEHGADVAIASRDRSHLDPVVEELESMGVDATATTVDVREPERVEAMLDTVLEDLGDVSILVNNAGANFLSPTRDLTPNGWRAVVGTILDGTAYCTLTVGEHFIERGGGVVLSMGATNSVRGAPWHAHSGAGKAGVHNLMQTVAAEWGEHGVRANTIAPGIVETDGLAPLLDGIRDDLRDETAVGRLGTSADVVPMTVFLASPAARYVTGGYFPVDGGRLLAPTFG